MVVGLCTMELRIQTSHSLKSKRRVLRSLIDRVRARFNVSIAEVESQDSWQRAVIGIAFVTNDQSHCHRVLSHVVSFAGGHGEAEVVDFSIELI